MCPPVSPCKGASIVKISTHNAHVLGMETPLRERSGGHAGTAPTVSFGWIACKWLFCLCGIAWKNITEMGRGGACVPARVALQGRIRRSSPAHDACVFIMETPLRGRSGEHAGTAPTVSFGWIVRKWLFCLCGIAWKNMMEMGRGGAYVPARVAPSRAHSSFIPSRMMRVFWVWKRRYADVRAGTQAPPLRVSFGWIVCRWLISFGWITCKWLFCLGRLCVEWLVSFGEWIVHGLRVSFGCLRANAVNPRGRKVVGESSL